MVGPGLATIVGATGALCILVFFLGFLFYFNNNNKRINKWKSDLLFLTRVFFLVFLVFFWFFFLLFQDGMEDHTTTLVQGQKRGECESRLARETKIIWRSFILAANFFYKNAKRENTVLPYILFLF